MSPHQRTLLPDVITCRANGHLYYGTTCIGTILMRKGYTVQSVPMLGPGLTDRWGRPRTLRFLKET